MILSTPVGARSLVLVLLVSAAACGGSVASPLTEKPDAGGSDDGGGRTDTGTHTAYEGGTCNVVEIENPIVSITDAVTGAAICDATVAGELSTIVLDPSGNAGSCPYTVSGYEGSAPTFSIAVTAPGYETATVSDLSVTYCGCGAPCVLLPDHVVSLSPLVDGGGPIPDASFEGGFPDASFDGGSPDASFDGGFDASASPCPPVHPVNGSSCAYTQLYCEYGSDPNPYCNDLAECDDGTWVKLATTNDCPSPSGTCEPYATLAAGGSCSADGQVCASSDGTCICTNDLGGLPTSGGPQWSCRPAMNGCPSPRPALGSPCDATTAPSECDYGACSGGVAETCVDGYWTIENTACPA